MDKVNVHFERNFIPKDQVDRKPSHEELERQMKEFLAKGGSVNEIPTGQSSDDVDRKLAHFNDFDEYRQRGQFSRHKKRT